MSDDGGAGGALGLVNDLLDRGYTRAFGAVARTINAQTSGGIIRRRLDELDAEAARLVEAGEKLTADNAYVRALLADVRTVLERDGGLLDAAGLDVQEAGIDTALRAARGGTASSRPWPR